MKLRKIIFWLHLIAGAAAGLVVFFMAATGFLLTYQRPITAAVDGYHVPVNGTPLTPEMLLEKVHKAKPQGAPTMVTLKADANAAVAITFGRDKILLVDPYQGAILGEGAKGLRTFYAQVTVLHRWLGGQNENRALGKAITGAATLLFLFLVLSGAYLWWPGRTMKLGLKLTGKARDWNWHNAVGFWSALPLILITLTGVIMSYTWASNLLFRLTGNEAPSEKRQERGDKPSDNWDFPGLDIIWTAAKQKIGPWQTVMIRLPREMKGSVTFMVEQGNGGRPDQRSQWTFDGENGTVKNRETFASSNWGKRLRTIARFTHTGEIGGIAGETIASLAALGAMVLVWTGLSMVWRRFFKRETAT